MTEIRPLDPKPLIPERQYQLAERLEPERREAALKAVAQENRAASIDRSELSRQSLGVGGQFSFAFDSAGTAQASFQGDYGAALPGPGPYSTSFSFAFTLEPSRRVDFPAQVQAGAAQIAGEDFSLSRGGILTLLKPPAGSPQASHAQQLDLGGKLDAKALETLQKLGLVDDKGQATASLQLFSDYTGLGRFKAGQQVVKNLGGYGAGMPAQRLGWQGWGQRNGLNVVDPPPGPNTAPQAGEDEGA